MEIFKRDGVVISVYELESNKEAIAQLRKAKISQMEEDELFKKIVIPFKKDNNELITTNKAKIYSYQPYELDYPIDREYFEVKGILQSYLEGKLDHIKPFVVCNNKTGGLNRYFLDPIEPTITGTIFKKSVHENAMVLDDELYLIQLIQTGLLDKTVSFERPSFENIKHLFNLIQVDEIDIYKNMKYDMVDYDYVDEKLNTAVGNSLIMKLK